MQKLRSFKPGSLPLLLLALVVLAYLAYLVLVPPPPPKPDDTWTRIQNEHVVRIGVDPSSPPFIADDGTGKLSGFDVALANELAQRWGVKVQYVYTGFDGLYDALNGGQFDLILSALPYNPLKTEDVRFSHPYFNNGPVLVVRGEDTTTTGLAELQGRAIAVELGSSGDTVVRKWQRRYDLTIQRFDTTADALRALQQSQVNAAAVDPISLYDFQRANQDTGANRWRVAGPPLAGENYVIAVRKDTPTLLGQINAVLDDLRQSGKLEELQKQNF